MPRPPRPQPEAVPERAAFALVLVLGTLLFCVRLAGPADLTDNDQEGPTAYVLDVVRNGHWLVQRDAHGEIASKPPLYTWLAALPTLAAGSISRFTLYLPCGVAVVGTALLVLRAGGRQFGSVAGLLAAFSIYFCQFGIKHVVLARTDAVFMATVTLGALAAFRAWEANCSPRTGAGIRNPSERGRGWGAFWIAAAGASLAKGPLGLALAGGGMLAAVWERRSSMCRPDWRQLWTGAGLYVALLGGWFGLAYLQVGEALTEKQLGRELVGHLSGASAGGHWPGSQPFHPFAYFLTRFAPWSVLACIGFWRICRRPAEDATERRFERFLFCWFFVGLAILVIAPHKRADLLLPILPAAAMLAGRELARLLARVRPIIIGWSASLVGLVILSCLPVLSRLKMEAAEVTTQTRAMRDMAAWLSAHAPPDLPLTFAGNAMTLEFYLNRHQFHTSHEQAAKLLQGEVACFIAVADLGELKRWLPADTVVHELARRPDNGNAAIHLISNRPALVAAPDMAMAVGPMSVRLTEAALLKASWLDLLFRSRAAGGEVTLENASARPVTAGAQWAGLPETIPQRRTLSAGDSWTVARGGATATVPGP